MRSASHRVIAAAAVTALAALTVGPVTAAPAHAAGGLRTHMDSFDEYPDLPPGQNLGWIVMAVNESGKPYTNVELSIDFHEADGELAAVKAIESTQDAIDCEEPDEGRSFVCVIPELKDEQNFDFELALRDGADRVNHGVTTAEAVMRVDGKEMSRDTATLDASLPLDKDRITDVNAPKQVWSHQVFGDDDADGAELSFTVHNNTDKKLSDASLFVKTDEKTGIVPGTEIADCTYDASGTQLGCYIGELGPGESRQYAFTLWAKDKNAWKHAKPGKVTIDVSYIHNQHNDAWGHAEAPIKLVKPGGDDVLPVTGSSLSTTIAVGAAAILLGVAVLLVVRRRLRTGNENLKLAAGDAAASFPH
ncbi:LPXTG cell wall anchor domain-containing protein [Stackebrandtia nassauensis]|uniref:LPXTG-motif cell wall anchor domain protein n=1 Tax=Stackebrandtia nassauensis (strain DSM 44728 / CIP 108903 / NRRL B-16338 / NBRC 102104 / LLR-40K-21) TaxID=446470 RepID=D3Q3J6_STANL|nr:LPXTG cell wall anchor domain-containing protein [Stackebrandtia nassauensis]ADD42037.1 LPXTG-motif cell wall anchor domain protein [Stackebrandtia nassauensis DSM 44728]